MKRTLDLTWRRFGRLVVVRFDGFHKNLYPKWICRCDCGKIKSCFSTNLLEGKTKSCGCKRRKVVKMKNFEHGMSNTRLYRIWGNMKDRCYRKNSPFYDRYGGRGIAVCDDWLDFGLFATWALGHGYNDDLSIDRIDNDKGYSPENCRWTTQYIQSRNTSRNRLITYNGKTMVAIDWAKALGISYSSLNERIAKYGLQAAMTMEKHYTPAIGEIEYNGKKMLAPEWAKLFGICRSTMYKRFKKYGIKKALEYSFTVKAKIDEDNKCLSTPA